MSDDIEDLALEDFARACLDEVHDGETVTAYVRSPRAFREALSRLGASEEDMEAIVIHRGPAPGGAFE